MYFAIVYVSGPDWLPDTPVFGQSRAAMRALAGHRDYMEKLLHSGKLVLGGPFADGVGGLALIEVDSAEQAAEIMADDPGIISGVFQGELHPFVMEFSRTGI